MKNPKKEINKTVKEINEKLSCETLTKKDCKLALDKLQFCLKSYPLTKELETIARKISRALFLLINSQSQLSILCTKSLKKIGE